MERWIEKKQCAVMIGVHNAPHKPLYRVCETDPAARRVLVAEYHHPYYTCVPTKKYNQQSNGDTLLNHHTIIARLEDFQSRGLQS
ncbi:hypothetical protein NECAME_08359 [Necator americanus]|uniref:Uncharacterized protein n=1 Tax=Necator americanus TaxID=51031 RepID=W2TKF8_NECAM|nr:hypothetical protein NECAME_08359 [Necator americanus]ETN81656.1 hypothetical protein NECAME_08359 [Necator americanus]